MAVQRRKLNNTVLAGLDFTELYEIGRFGEQRTAERGDILVVEGDPVSAMYIVVSGAVKTYKTSGDGKEQEISIVRPDESFNEASMFNGGTNLISARAIGHVVYKEISRSDIREIIARYPRVASNLLEIMGAQIQVLTSLIGSLVSPDIMQKVAGMLLVAANSTEDKRQKISRQQMAVSIGTSRGMIGSSLESLKSNGAIAIDHNRLIIKDKVKLEMLCAMNRGHIPTAGSVLDIP